MAARRRSVVAIVFFFLVLFFLLVLILDASQFQRLHGYDFKIGPAFRTRNDFALVNLIFFDIQIALAFRTNNHDDCLPVLDLAAK
jgi:hypothetical protein